MKFFSITFDHENGQSIQFVAISDKRLMTRNAMEKLLEHNGFKDVFMTELHEFSNESDYNQAAKIAVQVQNGGKS